MNLFKRKVNASEQEKPVASQTRDDWDSPFESALGNYIPLKANLDLYDIIREAVPILDVAVQKRCKLIGDFTFDTFGNERAAKILNDVKQRIRVGWFSSGFSGWMIQMIDSAFAKGFGVGEVVLTGMTDGIDRLKIAKANTIRFLKTEKGGLELAQLMPGEIEAMRLKNQDLLHYLAFDLRDGNPQGVSMYSSLPFLSKIVVRIQQAVDNTIWRIGDPTFYGVYKAGKGEQAGDVKKNVNSFVTQITEAMKTRKAGGVKDLAFGMAPDGDFFVKVLGAEAKMMDIEVPMKVIMEQVVAKSGIPPFMFGLSWSTTERMSQEQADMLVADIDSERSTLNPMIEKIFTQSLIFEGLAGVKWQHVWNPVNLMDMEKIAKTRLDNAQALKTDMETRILALDYGLAKEEDLLAFAIENQIVSEKSLREEGKEAVIERIKDKWGKKAMVGYAKLFVDEN